MNRGVTLNILGKVFLFEALFMIPAALVGACYREMAALSFLPPMFLLLLLGYAFSRVQPQRTEIYAKDGFFIVAVAWIMLSLFGAVPFVISGAIPSYLDALFEIVSGFTTTGATILAEVESLPKCLLFFRSFSHWIGGMGVLVFVLAILPLADDRALHLMRAEVPGPIVGKLVPRMRNTAFILYAVYTVLTVLLIILLLFGGMPLFDAVCHAFGTAGTGGFSVKNAGIAYYDSAYIDIVLSVFMLLFGINFNLYYLLLIGRVRNVLKSEELRVYLFIVLFAVVAVSLNTYHLYQNVGSTLRYAFFQVSSIITTTGYATVNFSALWPTFSQGVLLLLMVIGASAGSTGGGLKVSRAIVLCKSTFQEIRQMIHPRLKTVVRLEGRPVNQKMLQSTLSYFAVYLIIVAASTLFLLLDTDFTTAFTAELACFNNIGPALGNAGPMDNYAFFSPFSKTLLIVNMLLGRLEIFPILILFSLPFRGKTAD